MPATRALSEELLRESDALRDWSQGQEKWALLLAEEIATAGSMLRRGIDGLEDEDAYLPIVALRFISESAVRMSWLAIAGEDPGAMHARIARLLKLDIDQLRSADASFRRLDGTGLGSDTEADAAIASLFTLLDGVTAAPRRLDIMATEGECLPHYLQHRWCSTILHPGLPTLLRPWRRSDRRELQAVLLQKFAWVLVNGAYVLEELTGRNVPAIPAADSLIAAGDAH